MLSPLEMKALELQIEIEDYKEEIKYIENYDKYCHLIRRAPMDKIQREEELNMYRNSIEVLEKSLKLIEEKEDDGSYFYEIDLEMLERFNKHTVLCNRYERKYLRLLFKDAKECDADYVYVYDLYADLDYKVFPFKFTKDRYYSNRIEVKNAVYIKLPRLSYYLMKMEDEEE
jgi:hypothetical protein